MWFKDSRDTINLRMYTTLVILSGVVVSSSAFLNYPVTYLKKTCSSSEFACNNGRCILDSSRCDNKDDCGDASDEINCEIHHCEDSKFFRCKNNRCISKAFICDGENDCEDFSDEVNCESFQITDHVNSTCDKGFWQCTDKLCIPNDWVCNGEPDCLDGSDEGIGCSVHIVCDGFKCKNGHCIPNEWKCDGHDDCHDKSDEEHCENQVPIDECNLEKHKFLCHNNKSCIDLHKVCDGHHDCSDKSDESILCTLKTLSCALHNCSHTCIQLPTGPKCVCPNGYHNTDGKFCQEINECEQFDICDHKCRNTPGSYECYCESKYQLQSDKRTCKVVNGEATMVFSSKTEIRAYNLESQLYFPVARNLKQVVGVYYDGNHVYWTDIYSEHESIVRSLEDGSGQELLVTSGLGLPEDLAVDWLTGNIYFTDAENKHIGVCSSDGKHCTILINKDIRKPRGICLNVDDGEMYWTDWGEPAEIAYSLMDGSNDKSFVSTDIYWPNGLALDYPNSRLYWTDAKKMTLESIRLDGTDRRIILESVVKHPYAIAVFENKLYWSDWFTRSIQTCDKFSGKHHEIIAKGNQLIYGISIFHSALHQRTNNPCSLAFCSDICLLKGKTYTCGCPEGKVLSSDGHVCKEIGSKQMLIVGTGNRLIHIEHTVLGKHEATSLPTLVKHIGALAYDSVHNMLLISDLNVKKIVSLNLDSGDSKPLDISGLGFVIAMDYDPRGNNLYICDGGRGVVEVIDLNTLARKVLIHSLNSEIPEAVALVPSEGIMFVAFKKRGRRLAHLDRFYMDGTGRTHTIFENDLVGPISLHYDNKLHRIFVADAGTGDIETTSIEGDDRHSFRTLTTNPIGLTSLNDHLFWVNENSKRLFWTDKNLETSSNKKITLDIPEPDMLHIVSVVPEIPSSSGCYLNNNNCSHLCLLSHKDVICDCPAGFDMSENKHTCIKRQHCNFTEFLCSQSNTCILKTLICNGHKECPHGEDELDCGKRNHCAHGYFECNNGDCIKEDKVCDRNYDCKDKSDEQNCDKIKKQNYCLTNQFMCQDGGCIEETFVCDGQVDCKDESDEQNCSQRSCLNSQFRCDSGTCIPKSWECDNDFDCPDFSDEHLQCDTATCPPSLFTCENGHCIDKYLTCNEVDECGDNSDEHLCFHHTASLCKSDQIACFSNRSICLPYSAKCNGTKECPLGEDERDCSDCFEDEEFTCHNKNCIPKEWICDGHDDCGDSSDELVAMCSNRNQTIVKPVENIHVSCENGYRCKNGACIHMDLVCDGKHDCYDGSDEDGLCSTACTPIHNSCSHECIKTPIGPVCGCHAGYTLLGDGHECIDKNECLEDPPICSQLCQNVAGSYSCNCYDGFLLRSSKKSCKAQGQPMSIIFTTHDKIMEQSQRANQLSILFSAEMPRITGLDVSIKLKYVYFSVEEASSIHRIDLSTKVRHYMEHIGQPKKLALDWLTNNIYYYNADSQNKSISVCNFEAMICAKLITIDAHKHVSAIVVDSVNKVMFIGLSSWWVFNSPSYTIYKYNLDGTGVQELIKTTSGVITGLTLDHNKRYVYYTDQYSNKINMMDYNGKLNTILFANITKPVGLKFFEDHLYYLSTGGYMVKCKLYDTRYCYNFKLHSYSTDLFSIVQDSLQPRVENVCENNTCSFLCIPTETTYKCLCKNGTVISPSSKCDPSEINLEHKKVYVVHTVSMSNGHSKSHTGVIVASVLIPLTLLVIAATVLAVVKKKHGPHFNISMRFHNPAYHNRVGEEKPILQPGLHEYTNPVVHSKKEDLVISV